MQDQLSAAGMAAMRLARMRQPVPVPPRPQDAALLDGFDSFRFGPDDGRQGWAIGRGPLILLLHGWGGRGSQMSGLARSLAGQGFRCLLSDAGGHGLSSPAPLGFDGFIHDADLLTRCAGEAVHGWIGHSAGGLGMMASRALRGVAARRYVCIATPFYPYIPLDIMTAEGLGADVLEQAKPILATQFATGWPELEAGAAYRPEPGSGLLLVYDRADDLVRFDDADRIAALWPGADVMKTDGHGHNRVLLAPEMWERVARFLAS
jgi:pimeloyl-ACP methyl ester carboxylesterase